MIDAFNSVISAILKSDIIILKPIDPPLSDRVPVSIKVLSDTLDSLQQGLGVALHTCQLTWRMPFFE